MSWMLSITLILSILGQLNALYCFGHTCSGNQYCQVSLHSHGQNVHTGYCVTMHGNGHNHQLCLGMHHPGDHCFCPDQPCVDAMTQSVPTAPPVTQAPATAQPQTMAPTTQPSTQAPIVHIEAIPCGGSTCYTPQSCSVTFVNSKPTTSICSNTVASHCGPFPTDGVCECDSAFCMDVIKLLANLGTSTTSAPVVTTTAPGVTTNVPVTGTTPTVSCIDIEDANFTCKAYNDQFGMCLSNTPTLQRIAAKRCSKFCGFCGNGTVVTQSPIVGGSTTLPPCVDHDSRCQKDSFKQIFCNAVKPDIREFAISTCPRSCNLCPEYIASLTATPTPSVATPVSCNECGDPVLGIPCSQALINGNNSVQCPSDKPFCMTDLTQDPIGNKDIYKRCVNATTCQTKWIGESADQDYCAKYGVVTNPSQFECHFCCSGNTCNTGIVPPASTLVAKPTTG